MIQTALDRRIFLTSSLAGGVWAAGGFEVLAASFAEPIFPKPFVHSPTVTTFAQGLFFREDNMPRWLRLAVEDQLSRTDTTPHWSWSYRPASETELAQQNSDVDRVERRRAAFFARLTVKYLAPSALRRAGYEQMAIDVASGTLSPAGAQHTIGRQYASRQMPTLACCAYSASAHACTTAFYAAHRDIDVVAQTGYFCARTLLEHCDAANSGWVWNFAAMAINAAIRLEVTSDAHARRGQSLFASA